MALCNKERIKVPLNSIQHFKRNCRLEDDTPWSTNKVNVLPQETRKKSDGNTKRMCITEGGIRTKFYHYHNCQRRITHKQENTNSQSSRTEKGSSANVKDFTRKLVYIWEQFITICKCMWIHQQNQPIP